ncbi:MAG: DMT family transporter [Pseudomonadota bacterium]
MELGEAYALITAILWASAVVLFKHAGNSMSAHSLNLIKNVLGVGLLVPTAMFIEGSQLPQLSALHWLILIGSGYLGIAVADSWYFQALRMLGAGRTAIVGSLYSPMVIILSIVLLGERLAWWKWSGFVLVLCGILIAIYQRQYQQVDKGQLRSGIALAIGAVFMTALGVVAMKPVLENDGFLWLVCLRLAAGTLGLMLFLGLRGQMSETIRIIRFEQHKWPTILAASLCGTYLAMIFWLAGFKHADASVASVLNETSSIFIVLMAWLFLKEELSKRKVVGVLVAFIGVIIFIGA